MQATTITTAAGIEFELRVVTRTRNDVTRAYIEVWQNDFRAGDCQIADKAITSRTGMVWTNPEVRTAAAHIAESNS